VEKLIKHKNPDGNLEHAMDYLNREKSIGKNVPDEKSRDFPQMFMNSIKKSRV
jgi:hypothetical protein